MTRYELTPAKDQSQASFYGKAYVIEEGDKKTLYSYETPIMTIYGNGRAVRLWNDWSNTTGKHIFAFCDMHKKEFDKLDTI